MTFQDTLDLHLRSIRERDLAGLESTVAREGIVVVTSDGRLVSSTREFLQMHRDWFGSNTWSLDMEQVSHHESPEPCSWPWRGIYASYQGFSMPCCMISTPDRLNFGNLNKDSASDLWNSPSYEDFRVQLTSDRPPDICRSCSVYRGVF